LTPVPTFRRDVVPLFSERLNYVQVTVEVAGK